MIEEKAPISITDNNRTYYFKGSLLQNTTRTNTLTEYPTIEGTTFTDHYYREPESATFEVKASEISKSLVYSVELDSNGNRVEHYLTVEEVMELVTSWFKNAPRVTVTSLRFMFKNMVLQSYSWSDEDLSNFNPTLTFREAKVAKISEGVVENADLWYKAAYGTIQDVGGAAEVSQSPVNIGSAIGQAAGAAVVGGAAGALVGLKIGAVFGPHGAAVGAAVGAGVGAVAGAVGSLANSFHWW